MKCMFDPPPIRCPHDKGMEVKIYSSLSRVDTIMISTQTIHDDTKVTKGEDLSKDSTNTSNEIFHVINVDSKD